MDHQLYPAYPNR